MIGRHEVGSTDDKGLAGGEVPVKYGTTCARFHSGM